MDSISKADQAIVLQGVVDQVHDGVVVANSDGKFLLWNKAGQEIIGMGPMSVPIEEWSSVYGCFNEDGKTPCASYDLPLTKAIRGEKVLNQIICIHNATKETVWLAASAEPLVFANGTTGGIVVFRDITAHVKEKDTIMSVAKQLQDLIQVQKSILNTAG